MDEILLPSSRKVKPLLSGSCKYQGQDTNPSPLWPLRCRGAPAIVSRALTVITSYRDRVPQRCVRQCAGSFTHTARVTFATALRRWCFRSQVTVKEKERRAGEERSRVQTSIGAFLRDPRTEQQRYAKPWKGTGDIGHLGHDSCPPELTILVNSTSQPLRLCLLLFPSRGASLLCLNMAPSRTPLPVAMELPPPHIFFPQS